jgi:hypothetical protein
LFEMGKSLQSLKRMVAAKEPKARETFGPLSNSLSALNSFLAGDPFPPGISRSAAVSLANMVEEALDVTFYDKDEKTGQKTFKYPGENEITYYFQFMDTAAAIERFETVLATEMSESATYLVPQRGIYSTSALIDSADKSFPDNIYGHIPEKSKTDWRAAGRCLAFNLLSASGFHVARAVEATLEVYYQSYTAKTGTLRGWNDYIKALEVVVSSGASPRPAEKTLAELRQMKDDYRNPVMHPRVTLSENDARMLFDNGESLIIAMAEEIKGIRESGGAQGVLAVVAGTTTGP